MVSSVRSWPTDRSAVAAPARIHAGPRRGPWISTEPSDPLDDGAGAEAAAAAHRDQAVTAAGALELVQRCRSEGARRCDPVGWPSAIAPPFGLTRSGFGSELLLPGEHDGGERLVHLEGVDVDRPRSPACARTLCAMPGSDPSASSPGRRRRAWSRRCAPAARSPSSFAFSGDASRTGGGAVRTPATMCPAGVDAARLDGVERRELLERRVAQPFVALDATRSRRSALPSSSTTGAVSGDDLAREASFLPGLRSRAPGCGARSDRCPRA